MIADYIIKGKIFTSDSNNTIAEAAAVKGDKIIAVGNEAYVNDFVSDKTEIIEYDGLVMPAMTEGHAHITSTTDLIFGVRLHLLESVEEYVDAIADFAKAHPNNNVIIGGGYENGNFGDIGPTAKIIDAVVSDRPVILTGSDAHSYWLNSRAMEMIGLDENTPDVENGVIVRYSDGKPTGWLKEAAGVLFKDLVPDYTVEDYKEAILYYQNIALSNGVSIAFEPMFDKRKDYGLRARAYYELAQEGKLKIVFNAAYTIEADDDIEKAFAAAVSIREKYNCDNFRFNTIKLFMDGVIEGHTAYLRDEYDDAPNDYGEPMMSSELTESLVKTAIDKGFNLHIHTIGDAALDMILNAIEKTDAKNYDYRNAITHLQIAQPEQLDKMKELKCVAVLNPYWHFRNPVYFNELELPYLGRERAEKEYPLKSVTDREIIASQASDFPVTVPPRTMDSLHTMVNRKEPGKVEMEALGSDEAVDVLTGLKILTINGAYQNKLENIKGSIEVGKYADFAVLDKDVLSLDKEKIYKANVLFTYINGEIVWSK